MFNFTIFAFHILVTFLISIYFFCDYFPLFFYICFTTFKLNTFGLKKKLWFKNWIISLYCNIKWPKISKNNVKSPFLPKGQKSLGQGLLQELPSSGFLFLFLTPASFSLSVGDQGLWPVHCHWSKAYFPQKYLPFQYFSPDWHVISKPEKMF